MVYNEQTLANATWHNLNHIWSLNLNLLSNQLQLTCCKFNQGHINTIMDNIIICVSIALNLFLDCFVCSIDVQPEPEATPFVEDTVIEPRQQGKQSPL